MNRLGEFGALGWFDPAEVKTDPGEEHNLAGDPKHAQTMAKLKALVQRNWAAAYRPTE